MVGLNTSKNERNIVKKTKAPEWPQHFHIIRSMGRSLVTLIM